MGSVHHWVRATCLHTVLPQKFQQWIVGTQVAKTHKVSAQIRGLWSKGLAKYSPWGHPPVGPYVPDHSTNAKLPPASILQMVAVPNGMRCVHMKGTCTTWLYLQCSHRTPLHSSRQECIAAHEVTWGICFGLLSHTGCLVHLLTSCQGLRPCVRMYSAIAVKHHIRQRNHGIHFSQQHITTLSRAPVYCEVQEEVTQWSITIYGELLCPPFPAVLVWEVRECMYVQYV